MAKLSSDQLRGFHSETSDELRRQLKEKESILNAYRLEHGKLQLFFDDLVQHITPLHPAPQIFSKASKSKDLFPAVMHITDGHMGSVQEPNEIEGFGEFNPEICRARQIYFATKEVEWVNTLRHGYNIHSLHIIVTGDMISGDIHDELKITNAFPTPVQIIRAAEVLSEQIHILAPHFNQVSVEYIADDNHSRLTKKPQAKEAGCNSYNYIVAYIAKLFVQKIKNVEFNIYPMHEKVVGVHGRKYLATHGHGIQGWAGVPWYGIERRVSKEAQARLQMIMNAVDNELQMMREIGFHKFVFGHFHTPIDTPQYSGGGSVQGTDAYDHKSGRYSEPSQKTWLVNPKKGEFNITNFNLSHVKNL